jgi:uncharacterized protein (TIGR03118 family)
MIRRIFMQRMLVRHAMFTACVGVILMMSHAAMAQYQLRNLDSNQVGQASHTDPLIVNAWGLVHGPGTPWWVSDNNSGWSTLYNGGGVQIQQLKVLIPTAGENGPGSPTGIVFNPTAAATSPEFLVQNSPAVFVFAALDGTISGWAPGKNFNEAIVAVNNFKAGAMYTGLAVTNRASGNLLYAANMGQNRIDVFNKNFAPVKASFIDPDLPAGFSPFGIRVLNGLVHVTYAATNGGPGGFVDIFKEDGTFVKELIKGAPLNQPWGIAVAPGNFGPLSNKVLISNNVNPGTINAFDPVHGNLVGTVRDTDGRDIRIDQLWAIDFGGGDSASGPNNHLYFTAGPKNNLAGTFGVIQLAPQ